MKVILWLLALCAISSLAGANDEVSLMFEGNLQHQRKLSGLKFHFRTSRWLVGDYAELERLKPSLTTVFAYLKPMSFEETLSLRFDPSDSEHPWRTRWICNIPGSPTEPLLKLRSFFVLGDKDLHVFNRPDYRLVEPKDFPAHEDYFQSIIAGSQVLPKWYTRIDGKFYDPATRALLVNSKMSTIFEDPTGAVCRELIGWRVSGKGKFLGRDSVRMEYDSANPNEEAYLIALAPPDFTVVEFDATVTTPKGRFSVSKLLTTALDSINGVTYPAAGTVFEEIQHSEDGDRWSLATKFEIVSVEPIPQSELSKWVPEIPIGTHINENNIMRSVPFDEDFEMRVVRSMITAAPNKQTTLWLRLLLFSASVIVAIVFFFYSKRKR